MTVKSETISPLPQVHPGVRSSPVSTYISPLVAPSAATVAMVADTAYYQPIVLPGQMVNRIGINVTTGAAGLCRLGLYTNLNGVPSTLILDCGTVDTTSIALVFATIAATYLPVDYVWMAAVFNATPSVTVGVTANLSVGGVSNQTAANKGMTASFTYAAWPAAAPVTSLALASNVPMIGLRQS